MHVYARFILKPLDILDTFVHAHISSFIVIIISGEVQIHRLHWQKVWNLPAPEEDVSVRAMAWRPDGKACPSSSS